MGLFITAAAFGAGYLLGRPDGRVQLENCVHQARQLARRPEVKRLRERGWDLAAEQARAAKHRLAARRRSTVGPTPAEASTADASTAEASTAEASTAEASTADASTAEAALADAALADASTARHIRRGRRLRPDPATDSALVAGQVADRTTAPESAAPGPGTGLGETTVAEDSPAPGRQTLPQGSGAPGPTTIGS